jgi:hypothetical protein
MSVNTSVCTSWFLGNVYVITTPAAPVEPGPPDNTSQRHVMPFSLKK